MGEVTWGEISHYMRDLLLRDSDVMSMSHSLEIRVPFLDNKLVDYLISLPAGLKFEASRPKSLLLDAAEDLISREIWDRPKMGFSLPMKEWMLGPLRGYCEQGIENLTCIPAVDPGFIKKVWGDFERGRGQWTPVWSAVVLGNYLSTKPRS